jgi:aspartate/methionine/tyrosine aminotransferase
MAATRKAALLKQQGVDVVNLAGGMPYPPAPGLADPVAFARSANTLGDPAGDPLLRSRLARLVGEELGLEIDPVREVVVSIGAKEALFAVLMTLIDPGDDVITFDPCWVTYAPAVQMAGGRVRTVRLSPERFALDGEALLAAVTPATRALIVNSPHNPTGRVFTEAELDAVTMVAQRFGLWVIADESFDKFVFDRPHESLAARPGMRERTVILRSFSKAYALPGLRVGFMIAPEPVCALAARFNEQVLSSVSPLSQSIASSALDFEPGWTRHLRDAYRAKRDLMMDHVRRMSSARAAVPEGTFYVFLDVRALGLPSAAVVDKLLTEARVAVTPGSAFGAAGEGYVRLNLAGDPETIAEGARRLEAAFA